jgi:hypothetical protein
MPVLAVWLLSLGGGSPWGVVAVCVAFNVISLIAIVTAPETLGIDMYRADSAARLATGDDLDHPVEATQG